MSYLLGKKQGIREAQIQADSKKTYRNVSANVQLLAGNVDAADHILGKEVEGVDLEKGRTVKREQEHQNEIKREEVVQQIVTTLMGKSKSLTKSAIEQKIEGMTFGEKEQLRDELKTTDDEKVKDALREAIDKGTTLKGLSKSKSKNTPMTKKDLENVVGKAIHMLRGKPKYTKSDFDTDDDDDSDDEDSEESKEDLEEDSDEEEKSTDPFTTPKKKSSSKYVSIIKALQKTPEVAKITGIQDLLDVDEAKDDDDEMKAMRLEAIFDFISPQSDVSDYIKQIVKREKKAAEDAFTEIIRSPKTRAEKATASAAAAPSGSLSATPSRDKLQESIDLQSITEKIANKHGITLNPIYKKGAKKGQPQRMKKNEVKFLKRELESKLRRTKVLRLSQDIDSYLEDIGLVFDVEGLSRRAETLTGRGISKKLPFGNFLVDHKKLKKNILSVTYLNGQKVHGINNKQISDNMKKVFTKQKVNSKKVTLTDTEKMFLRKLMDKSDATVSKSKQKLVSGIDMINVHDLKSRLNLLVGEIQAGNDSPIVKQELVDLVEKLLYLGMITKKQAVAFLSEF